MLTVLLYCYGIDLLVPGLFHQLVFPCSYQWHQRHCPPSLHLYLFLKETFLYPCFISFFGMHILSWLIVIVLFATHLDAPLTADQMDEEESYGGRTVLMQQPGVAVANDNVDMVCKIVLCMYILILIISISLSMLQRVMHKKGKHAFVLSIVSFILCGLATLSTTMICHIILQPCSLQQSYVISMCNAAIIAN